MKLFATLLMASVLTFACSLAIGQAPEPVDDVAVVTTEEVAVRVYMIEDPEAGDWYRSNALGLAAWGQQTEAACWTVRRDAERTLSGMFGQRARRCVVREFLVVAVTDG